MVDHGTLLNYERIKTVFLTRKDEVLQLVSRDAASPEAIEMTKMCTRDGSNAQVLVLILCAVLALMVENRKPGST